MTSTNAFILTHRPDHVAVITFDVPGEKVNTLKAAFAGELREVIWQVRSQSQLVGIILLSGKPDSFIAGADINMIADCRSAGDAGVG